MTTLVNNTITKTICENSLSQQGVFQTVKMEVFVVNQTYVIVVAQDMWVICVRHVSMLSKSFLLSYIFFNFKIC